MKPRCFHWWICESLATSLETTAPRGTQTSDEPRACSCRHCSALQGDPPGTSRCVTTNAPLSGSRSETSFSKNRKQMLSISGCPGRHPNRRSSGVLFLVTAGSSLLSRTRETRPGPPDNIFTAFRNQGVVPWGRNTLHHIYLLDCSLVYWGAFF